MQQAIRYQNFTGTTRSGHTLRTAAISADEDVQMRRRLQQQQLDRDDRNFTAIWHSRLAILLVYVLIQVVVALSTKSVKVYILHDCNKFTRL